MTVKRRSIVVGLFAALLIGRLSIAAPADAADKLTGIHSARVLSQAMPWIAREAGLFKKYNLDFDLVFIASSPAVTAAMLGGDAEIALTGGEGMIRAYVQGSTDFVFIAGVKNVLTHSILSRPEIKSPQDLKGKKIGINRIGSNPHYFAVQALRRFGIDPSEVHFMQSGGAPETLAALLGGGLDAAALTAPADAQALSRGFQYTIYGPDLRVPYTATALVTRRPVLAARTVVLGQFVKIMAEAGKILHSDKEFTFKVLGKYLRLDNRKILEAAYASEIKVLEPRLELKAEGFRAILDEIARIDGRAKKIKPHDLIDGRFLDEMEKSDFFTRLWGR
jgi:ABC-type nitrate/sulfonate/bicarbonate transport system substrate-binding protein